MDEFFAQIWEMAKGPFGLLILALVMGLMEIAKGFVPQFVDTTDKFKRAVAISLGMFLGLILSLIPQVGQPFYVGMIVGLLASIVSMGIKEAGSNGPARKKTMKSGKGFARLTTMILTALAALIMLGMLSGCAHLTPKEQEAVNASMTCASDILTAAQTCVPECIGLTEKTGLKQCAVACVVSTIDISGPACGKVYGDIYSPALGTAISATVVSIMQVYEAVDK